MTASQVIDPRTATPCRTVVFAGDEHLIEANYLGFITTREIASGTIVSRVLGQTALVETMRYSPQRRELLLVGAGFEGYRDFGKVKLFTFPEGNRLRELDGHWDDITDICLFPDLPDIAASIGLDRRLVVHNLNQRDPIWIWDGYEDYLNMCAARPGAGGHVAIAGDSPFTYVLDTQKRSVVAKIDTPGDSNGLVWSPDGRYLLVGDDHGVLKYFDSSNNFRLCRELNLGGAIKKTVPDPLSNGRRGVAACYDGQLWGFRSFPRPQARVSCYWLLKKVCGE
jgi:WD40 repeat protein